MCVHSMDVHSVGAHSMGVPLMGAHSIGVHSIGAHSMDVDLLQGNFNPLLKKGPWRGPGGSPRGPEGVCEIVVIYENMKIAAKYV